MRNSLTRRLPAAALAVAALGAAAGCSAQADAAETAAPALPDAAQIEALLPDWNTALATGDPEQVADRYAEDAVLVPTVANEPRTDRAGIVDYFEHFLENEPVATVTESHVNVLDEDSAVDNGTYSFVLTDDDGDSRTVEARYTFVYELRDGTWKIVSHHSSAFPED